MNFTSKIFEYNNSIPLNEFIEKSLYDPKYGFYMKKNPISAHGDFITAPYISILFTEMIGIWCVSFWEKLGKPNKINLVELGPGDGTLSKNLVNTFYNFKKFNEIYKLKLFEKSKHLIKIQKSKIISDKVEWISNLNEIKNGPTIFIANEFFDALPIKQFFLKKKQWYERYVENKNSIKLKFVDKKTVLPNFKKICLFDYTQGQSFLEFSIDTVNYLKDISKILNKHDGGLLCFDYGYQNKKMFNSLQSVRNQAYSSILLNPGNNDISHLINFSFISKLSNKLGLKVVGITNQGKFLKKIGIVERANIISKNKNFRDIKNIYFRLKRLIDPGQMGKIFKVIFLKKRSNKFDLGFK